MDGNIFLTGATGFLGSEIVSDLINQTDKTIYVLIRARSTEAADRKLRALWWENASLRQAVGSRVVPLVGDIALPGLGIASEIYKELQANVGYIIHAAAEISINPPRGRLWNVNVKGTQNMLDFAARIHDSRKLKRFSYVSTAYAAGRAAGVIPEAPLQDRGFNSLYEQSKFEAEKLVRNGSFPITIFRPGMIVGHSETARVKNFNTIYYVLKQVLNNRLRVLPVSKNQKVGIVPVNYVSSAVARLTLDEEAADQTFHLLPPPEMQPTAGELAEAVIVWTYKHLHIKVRSPLFMPFSPLARLGARFNMNQNEKKRKKKSGAANLLSLMPYFFDTHRFATDNAERFLGPYSLPWRTYIGSLLQYACRKNFLHHTERTVFEQAQVRRQSKSAPITYFDVTADGIRKLTGEEMSLKITQTLSALTALGVRRGSKVALTGINSTDYYVLDTAIGLAGGVSVPLYYTTPIHEIDLLLEKSGAQWLFVGDIRILRGIDELRSSIPLISFTQTDEALDLKREVTSWPQFLAMGKGETPSEIPAYGDIATIRYTSGTTGEPKGVMFNHYQLRWMAETLTSLLSWKARNSTMRYLSFLPMSHVVEGILASYAPYYVLTDVEYYYLNDFGSLTESLPRVRPTVFFSVPRFYEKLWEKFTRNKAGKLYLGMKDGAIKRALGKIVRQALLKKAGLDRCDQLIVGSAPVSEELLLSFRALGIEIHNAYGLTEAPLITMNRLRDNKIPSIGTPLPDTEVKIAPDGEIIVRGPQVALGYYGEDSGIVRGGELRTGDLGSRDADNHLFIAGRKKEILITSYGKNVNLQKVETMLKNIPCVSEAVLAGENRPYCVALLWIEGEAGGIGRSIEMVNSRLSDPEKVRKWTVIAQPLSIAAGELTPNLKLRRDKIMTRYEKEIAALYQDQSGGGL